MTSTSTSSVMVPKDNVAKGRDLWTNSKYKDFDIIIGDQILHAHKCVLAARSPVFAAMLTSGMTETKTGQLIIQDFDYEIVEKAIKFCYFDSVISGINVSNIWNLLTFGHKYDIEHLVRACLFQILICRISYDNGEKKFLVKSAFDLGFDQILDPILNIFGVISGNLSSVSDTPYPALGDTLLAQDDSFKDLKIICDNDAGTEFLVHKSMLALGSPVLAQILDTMAQNDDTSAGQLKISQLEPIVFKQVLEFLYTGDIVSYNGAFDNNLDLLLDILGFAVKFRVQELITFSLQKLNQCTLHMKLVQK